MEGTRLLRQPTVSRDHLAFVYGGDIWVSDRDGGHPVQLTSHPASEFAPHFSPDGQWIAFSANYRSGRGVGRRLFSNEGRDPQLDAAIAEVLEELKSAKPIPLKNAPPIPTQVGQ